MSKKSGWVTSKKEYRKGDSKKPSKPKGKDSRSGDSEK